MAARPLPRAAEAVKPQGARFRASAPFGLRQRWRGRPYREARGRGFWRHPPPDPARRRRCVPAQQPRRWPVAIAMIANDAWTRPAATRPQVRHHALPVDPILVLKPHLHRARHPARTEYRPHPCCHKRLESGPDGAAAHLAPNAHSAFRDTAPPRGGAVSYERAPPLFGAHEHADAVKAVGALLQRDRRRIARRDAADMAPSRIGRSIVIAGQPISGIGSWVRLTVSPPMAWTTAVARTVSAMSPWAS